MAITMMSTITKAIGGPTSKRFFFAPFFLSFPRHCRRIANEEGTKSRHTIPFSRRSARAYYSHRLCDSCNSQNTTNYEDYYLYPVALSPLLYYVTVFFLWNTLTHNSIPLTNILLVIRTALVLFIAQWYTLICLSSHLSWFWV